MADLLPNGMQQFFDNNGDPLSSGTVDFYIIGTTTRKTTWQDADGSVANTNPITLDSAGRATIFGSGGYRQVLKNSAGTTIWDKNTYSADPDGTPDGGTPQYFTGDDSTTTFTLSSNVGTDADTIEVYIKSPASIIEEGGFGRVRPELDYTVSGTSLIFANAPPKGVDMGTGTAVPNIMVIYPNGSIAAAVAAAENAAVSAQASSQAVRWNFDSSTTMADPGAGDFRLNAATFSAVTAMAISDTCAESGTPDMSTWVLTWDNPSQTPRSTLAIRMSATVWALYGVNGAITDNGTWLQVPLSYIGASSAGGMFTNTNTCFLGDQLNGSNGSGVVDSVTAADASITVGGTAADPTISRAALTGDVTASAGSNTTAIANGAVTYAKIQDVSAASRLLGRGAGGGSGDPEEISLGTGLSMSGTTLNSTASSVDVQTFTASGTWTKPASGTVALIECWGGGASGGSGNAANAAGGGGGGNYASKLVLLSSLGATESATVGAGGTAVATDTAGVAGGNSSLGSALTAYGGGAGGAGNGGGGGGGGAAAAGSAGSVTNGGAGGGPSGGTAGVGGGSPGGAGGASTAGGFGGGGGGGSANTGVGGDGGAAGWGGGGGGGHGEAGDTGGNGGASAYGGGGGGGGSDSGTGGTGGTSTYGGAGGAGQGGSAAVDGTAPGGGGGGARNGGTSGAGARGQVRVTVW